VCSPKDKQHVRFERRSPFHWRVIFDQARIKALMERGFHKSGDTENRLGYYVGQLRA
jgi:hypothetical protein